MTGLEEEIFLEFAKEAGKWVARKLREHWKKRKSRKPPEGDEDDEKTGE